MSNRIGSDGGRRDVHLDMIDTAGGPLYPIATLYGPSGAVLAQHWAPGTATFNAPISTTGTYTVVVSDYSTGAGPYSLVITGAGGADPGGGGLPVPSSSGGALLALAALLAGVGAFNLRGRATLHRC